MGALVDTGTLFLSGGSGLDTILPRVLTQLQGIKLLQYTAGGTIAAATKATVTLSDGVSPTLKVDARLGGEHGNSIYIETIRNAATFLSGAATFDLNVYFKDQLANAVAFTAVTSSNAVPATANTFTKAAHGLKTGDGPFLLSNSGGGLPAGVTATVAYWAVVVDANNIRVATSKANAIAGTVIDITTDGTGTQSYTLMKSESFAAVSMVNGHTRYVVTMVNVGAHGTGPSEYIRVTDQNSVNAEDRPVAQAATVLSAGAGEVTVTGIRRGDHIASALNQTTPGAPAATFDATDKDKAVLSSGTFTTAASDKVNLLILPKA